MPEAVAWGPAEQQMLEGGESGGTEGGERIAMVPLDFTSGGSKSSSREVLLTFRSHPGERKANRKANRKAPPFTPPPNSFSPHSPPQPPSPLLPPPHRRSRTVPPDPRPRSGPTARKHFSTTPSPSAPHPLPAALTEARLGQEIPRQGRRLLSRPAGPGAVHHPPHRRYRRHLVRCSSWEVCCACADIEPPRPARTGGIVGEGRELARVLRGGWKGGRVGVG